MTIKHNGKMVPAKQVGGKWVPDEGSELVINGDVLEVRPKGEAEKGGEQNEDANEKTDDEDEEAGDEKASDDEEANDEKADDEKISEE